MDGMDGDSKMGEGSSGDLSKRQGLIAVNDLTYVLEPDLSVASNKTHKKHFFQSNEYNAGQQAICILNSGADYIDTRRSWLQFDISLSVQDALCTGLFGHHGSALNLIRDITISTRSGDELCRITDLNLLSNMLLPVTYDTEWFKNQGRLMGYGGCVSGNGDPDDEALQNIRGSYLGTRLSIPMYCLCPLFSYGRLMPAMLMSGLRIEITWEQSEKAFNQMVTATGARVAVPFRPYTIKNPQFVLSSVQLSDSIQRALNELSATNGLEIVYVDYEKTVLNNGTDLGSFNCEVRKSCSRALKAFARVRTLGAGGAEHYLRDSFCAEATFPFLSYQWQLGSLYFPQQKVEGITPLTCANEAYNHVLESCDKYHGSGRQPFLTYQGDGRNKRGESETFLYDQGALAFGLDYSENFIAMKNPMCVLGRKGSFANDQHMISVTLERSTMFNLAGVPVNNSRVLALRGTITGLTGDFNTEGNAVNGAPVRQLDIYLKYVKLARVFLNNVEVEQ
jgi:hypothetical protein